MICLLLVGSQSTTWFAHTAVTRILRRPPSRRLRATLALLAVYVLAISWVCGVFAYNTLSQVRSRPVEPPPPHLALLQPSLCTIASHSRFLASESSFPLLGFAIPSRRCDNWISPVPARVCERQAWYAFSMVLIGVVWATVWSVSAYRVRKQKRLPSIPGAGVNAAAPLLARWCHYLLYLVAA